MSGYTVQGVDLPYIVGVNRTASQRRSCGAGEYPPMSYRRVTIADCVQARTVNGDPFLKLTLLPAGTRFDDPSVTIRANCFLSDMFNVIYGSKDSGVPVVLDIAEAKTTDRRGRPLLNVVGFEHPGQGMLFGMGDE